MACAYLTDLATNIWKDLGEPADISVSYIQYKLVSNPFVGKLDNLISSCHTITSGSICPALTNKEQSIYALMYESDFWGQKLAKITAGQEIQWTRLEEGDSKITRVSSVEQGKLYKDMQRQTNEQLNYLVNVYRQNSSTARSVDFYTIDNNNWGSYWVNNFFITDNGNLY